MPTNSCDVIRSKSFLVEDFSEYLYSLLVDQRVYLMCWFVVMDRLLETLFCWTKFAAVDFDLSDLVLLSMV